MTSVVTGGVVVPAQPGFATALCRRNALRVMVVSALLSALLSVVLSIVFKQDRSCLVDWNTLRWAGISAILGAVLGLVSLEVYCHTRGQASPAGRQVLAVLPE